MKNVCVIKKKVGNHKGKILSGLSETLNHFKNRVLGKTVLNFFFNNKYNCITDILNCP